MAREIDLLNRPPIMRPREEAYDREEDWKGEEKIRAQDVRTQNAKKMYQWRHGEKD